MGEGTWEYIGGAILVLVVFILIVLIAFPMLREGKSDVMNIYKKVFGLERPEEEVLKEKSAIDTFNKFLEQLNNCFNSDTDRTCSCDFGSPKIKDYIIKGDSIGENNFDVSLFDGKTRALIETNNIKSSFRFTDRDGKCQQLNYNDKPGEPLLKGPENFELHGDKLIRSDGYGEETIRKLILYLSLNNKRHLCFVSDKGDDEYKGVISCKDVPRKLEFEKRGDEVVKTLFNQLDECLNRGKSSVCNLNLGSLEDGEMITFRPIIGDVWLKKEGFASKSKDYSYDFKIAWDGENCNGMGATEFFYLYKETGKIYLKRTIKVSEQVPLKSEIYISDENTICFLKEN